MDSWVYCCVIAGLATFIAYRDGQNIINFVHNKAEDQSGSTQQNKNQSVHVTNAQPISEDGFQNLTRSRTCTIQSKEALSALQRVESAECRQRLETVACLNQEEKLYPKSLPRFCSRKSKFEKGVYIGCYKDSKPERDFKGHKADLGEYNAPDACIELCLTSSYMYAGLQYETECWCSNTYGKYGTLPEWACASVCPGNKSETCGGANANRIFSTGLPDKIDTPNAVVPFHRDVAGLRPVRIAFVLTVHGRAVRQVKRLIKTLYRPYHYFFIHVDKRSKYMFRELEKLEHILPNLRLSRVRFSAIWAGISLLQGHFAFMKSLLEFTDWNWDYYMNLSESDYPIKSLSQLEWYLTKYKGNNFIAVSSKKDNKDFTEDQPLYKTFYECDQHMWRLGGRKLPTGIRFVGGSDWVTLHRDFVEYIMSDSDPLIRGMKRVYEFTSFSTESFFHTLILNSAFCDRWINANLHMINWKWDIGCQCQQKHIIDWCGCSPNDLKLEDMPKLMRLFNQTAYFARKFEPVVSNNILNDLDFHVHRDIKGIQGYTHYWQSDYNHLDGHHKHHDLFVTATNSMLRRTHRVVKRVSLNCKIEKIKILETNLLFVMDRFHSYLIKYNATVPGRNEPVTLEARFNVIHHQRIVHKDKMWRRLKIIEVGTDYDVKEQIFRNFPRIIGVDSEISLRHVWEEGPEVSVAFSWVDPAGVVAHFEKVRVKKLRVIEKQQPKLKTPLRPGEWVVKVTHEASLIAEMKFIVLPYSVRNGTKMTSLDVDKYHNGPEGHYFIGDTGMFSQAYDVTDKERLFTQAGRNGQKSNSKLVKWIDVLSEQLWGTKDICTTEKLGNTCPPLPLCEKVLWSSLSPDFKSEIDKKLVYKSIMGVFN